MKSTARMLLLFTCSQMWNFYSFQITVLIWLWIQCVQFGLNNKVPLCFHKKKIVTFAFMFQKHRIRIRHVRTTMFNAGAGELQIWSAFHSSVDRNLLIITANPPFAIRVVTSTTPTSIPRQPLKNAWTIRADVRLASMMLSVSHFCDINYAFMF